MPLADADLEHLEPHDVDDDYITHDTVSEQPKDLPSLVVGFRAEKRLLKYLMLATRGSTSRLPASDTTEAPFETHRALLEELTYILDDMPPALQLWQVDQMVTEPTQKSLRSSQCNIQRANIHVTHLWARVVLLDQNPARQSDERFFRFATKRESLEDICRQMLHLLLTSDIASLEPNGNVLVRTLSHQPI